MFVRGGSENSPSHLNGRGIQASSEQSGSSIPVHGIRTILFHNVTGQGQGSRHHSHCL